MQEETISNLTSALINLDVDLVRNILYPILQDRSRNWLENEEILIKSQSRIGELWERGEVALSQVYMAGKICSDLLKEVAPSAPTATVQKIPIYTVVLEDFHVLGKEMLISILHMSGFSVIDYGHGITVNELITRIQRDKPEILMISTLMLHSALKIKQVREKLNEKDIRIKLIVGGAPFNIDPNLWKSVGADATATTASKSIKIVKRFMEEI